MIRQMAEIQKTEEENEIKKNIDDQTRILSNLNQLKCTNGCHTALMILFYNERLHDYQTFRILHYDQIGNYIYCLNKQLMWHENPNERKLRMSMVIYTIKDRDSVMMNWQILKFLPKEICSYTHIINHHGLIDHMNATHQSNQSDDVTKSSFRSCEELIAQNVSHNQLTETNLMIIRSNPIYQMMIRYKQQIDRLYQFDKKQLTDLYQIDLSYPLFITSKKTIRDKLISHLIDLMDEEYKVLNEQNIKMNKEKNENSN
jgi:hypothetical protein